MVTFLTSESGAFLTTEDGVFIILDIVSYPLLLTLTESVEFGISLSKSTECDIALSETGGGS